MALPVRDQLKYWGIAAVVFLLLLWLLSGVLLPFVVGAAIAYFLDPVADWLEEHGFTRAWATVTITLIAAVVFTLMVLLVVPELTRQAGALINVMPELIRNFQTFLQERFPSVMVEGSTLNESLQGISETIKSKGGELLNGVLASALSLINVVALIVLVPVVTFYLLLDWDRMVAEIDKLLPRDPAPVIRRLAREIDATLASFIRGQGTVCLILGVYYAIGLMLTGLQFGLIVGALAGLISFIPYVGAIIGGALALGLALFQFWGEWWMIGAVGAVFAIGQVVEGNILTPKLVGGSVGLHPVWLIFALSAFGSLFGFVGMLIAVPVSASIGVVARWATAQYKDSRLYKGISGREDL
ncbi:AI-2E family transporter [Actibacterium sp. XHP0104]|uniref:AI-2E family transporter n=1 Tax=Actibacterium sp. XHP0104 TaxID=2984335 RepID=UPI0021E839B7|nr:AI-2E family transporter [Actibacterium sp. XHP0104]MCV2880627.1 AI-2E family transporter [Actibacterium sp. XHP0104]